MNLDEFVEKVDRLDIDEFLAADFNKTYNRLSVVRNYIENHLDLLNEDQLYNLAKFLDKAVESETL